MRLIYYMDIIEVNGKKYIRQNPVSGVFIPIISEQTTVSKPIDIINPIKPIFSCNRHRDK